MKNTLRTLLEEFLPEELIEPIMSRAKTLNLTTKVRKIKGRWNKETLRKLIKEQSNRCSYCQADGNETKLTLDHIVPKAMLLDMGLEKFYEDESNLEVLCSKCNSRKGSRLNFNNPKTMIQLQKYMDACKKNHE